jgi:group II intron reverse transcriptase/maturase
MESFEGQMKRTPSQETISTKLERIANQASKYPEQAFTTLAHHIDNEWLREAYRRTRKDGAAGVDGQTASDYERDLEGNLGSLLDRFKAGTYRAPPVLRVYIPKADGNRRPIGIPTLEDKILQRAVSMILEAIYEQDFLDCSYGFRPKRSAHQALEVVRNGLMDMRGGWVLEVDIKSYFDTLEHRHMRDFLDKRVGDGVIRRMIHKWLKAGVMEAGELRAGEAGTPQGGVISPLLANVYLHEVLDVWFETEVRRRMRGQSFMVRYADDAVLVFERKDDAERVMEVIGRRFAKYGLELHPDKTRLVEFVAPGASRRRRGGDEDGPGSFDLLGFTHMWGKSRKGNWVVQRKTAKGRLARALQHMTSWCRRNRHRAVKEQHKVLCWKLRGHYGYYGITGNARALERYWDEVTRIWHKWLNRRSGRKHLRWERFKLLLARYPLPRPRIVHSALRRPANP